MWSIYAADPGLIKDLPHSIHKVNSKGDGGRAEGDFWCVRSSCFTAVCHGLVQLVLLGMPESSSCILLLYLLDRAFVC